MRRICQLYSVHVKYSESKISFIDLFIVWPALEDISLILQQCGLGDEGRCVLSK